MTHHILFVDDESNILKSIERIFHGSPFHLHFAESGEEGLEILKGREMSVIISDMRMPGMSGVEFLKLSKDYSPDSTRIILSAYSDIEDIMQAVNEGHVHNYLTKPWENERLKIVIYNGTMNYEKSRAVKDLAEELKVKNKLLEEMNTNLEGIVEKRSRELFERNRILTLMLSSSDDDFHLGECLRSLVNLIGRRDFYLLLEGDKADVDLEMVKPPVKILQKSAEFNKPVFLNEYFLLPLLSGEEVRGRLFISPMGEEDKKLLPEIISMGKLMSLIINQKYNITHSDEILESLDSLMEELSD